MNATHPHDDAMVELLREDAAFAEEYLAASQEAIDEPGGREALLMALRQVAQAQGMDAVAERTVRASGRNQNSGNSIETGTEPVLTYQNDRS